MPERQSETGILNRLSLNHWYKYLLYLGGIILFVGLYFYLQYPLVDSSVSDAFVKKVIYFAIYTIIIGISLWILNDVLESVYNYIVYKDDKYHEDIYFKVAVYLKIFEYLIWVIAFFIWIFIALGTA
ncbi:MAG: hypothetical protein M1166_02515 [Candidatus Thermoplasmatota archaeon]|jgi:hypothetical protein|nr:hypothetical protein [Candidatus Thermoplasmatota archaeon]